MADMTTKHFTLIQDAINEGCWDALNDICRDIEGYNPVTTSRAQLVRVLQQRLGDSFGSRLAYTHDKFESQKFKQGLNLVPSRKGSK